MLFKSQGATYGLYISTPFFSFFFMKFIFFFNKFNLEITKHNYTKVKIITITVIALT